jgi:hypothetical protein
MERMNANAIESSPQCHPSLPPVGRCCSFQLKSLTSITAAHKHMQAGRFFHPLKANFHPHISENCIDFMSDQREEKIVHAE